MPKIRVTKHGGFKYGVGPDRQQYGLGKELIVKQKDARTLVAAHLAEIVVEGDAPKPKAKAKTTSAKATTRTTRKSKPVSAAGTYNRRDMKAK